ncbi:MAG: glycosyltransferase, partial [Microcystaceae cyanobacterium]
TETAKAYHAVQDLIFTANMGNSDDLKQWQDQIEDILANLSSLSQLRTPVAQFAQEHWSWQKTGARYWHLLDQ